MRGRPSDRVGDCGDTNASIEGLVTAGRLTRDQTRYQGHRWGRAQNWKRSEVAAVLPSPSETIHARPRGEIRVSEIA